LAAATGAAALTGADDPTFTGGATDLLSPLVLGGYQAQISPSLVSRGSPGAG